LAADPELAKGALGLLQLIPLKDIQDPLALHGAIELADPFMN
jgi:hypothetical protein